jgi:NAD(P)-dependent dehydrogenase (short-subunit alcohol dehydrogenase family)
MSGSWTTQDIGDLGGKVAIVTGANTGIGFVTARVLAQRGADVTLACRSVERGKQAVERIRAVDPKGSAELLPLDLSSLAAVDAFARTFRDQYQRLDLLINNAGVMMTPRSLTEDGFELQFGTNHLGHFALTMRLMPLIQATPRARIVNVSSLVHRQGRMNWEDLMGERAYSRSGAYAQSKLANLHFTFELQRRLEADGMDAMAVAAHPGWAATELQRHVWFFRVMDFLAQDEEAGALPTLYAATGAGIKGGDYYGPSGFMEMRGRRPAPAQVYPHARDEEDARRLWEISERLTGVVLQRSSTIPER